MINNNNNIWNTKVFNVLEKRKYYDIIPKNILNITYFDLLYMTDNEIEYLLIKLNKEHFFIIDDHPNISGHKEIAKKIYHYLNAN